MELFIYTDNLYNREKTSFLKINMKVCVISLTL